MHARRRKTLALLDELGFFFFQVEHDHGPCVSTARSCFLPNNQTIIKKIVRHPEKKTKWRLKGKRGRRWLSFFFGMQNDFLRVALS